MNSPSHRDSIRVGFDVSGAAGRRSRGIASYIRSLLPAIQRAAPWIQPVLLLRGERWLRKSAIADLLPDAERRWVIEPLKVPVRHIDIFHGMGTSALNTERLPCSFTLHDLREYDLGGITSPARSAEQNNRKNRAIRRADRILCISEYSRDRLLHHFPSVDSNKTEVIHHAVDHDRFHPREREEEQAVLGRLGINAPFFIQIGSFFPHKNLELSLKGFARSRALKDGFQLLFVGGGGSEAHRAELRQLSHSLGLSDRIAWVDDLSPDALPATLSAARGLRMPSRYEGFGLPVLEAMASGVPGICSNATCLPEVASGIWDTCDPDDEEAFAEAMDLLASDDSEHARRSTAGLERAKEFTWERCAEHTAQFLTRVATEATVP